MKTEKEEEEYKVKMEELKNFLFLVNIAIIFKIFFKLSFAIVTFALLVINYNCCFYVIIYEKISKNDVFSLLEQILGCLNVSVTFYILPFLISNLFSYKSTNKI